MDMFEYRPELPGIREDNPGWQESSYAEPSLKHIITCFYSSFFGLENAVDIANDYINVMKTKFDVREK